MDAIEDSFVENGETTDPLMDETAEPEVEAAEATEEEVTPEVGESPELEAEGIPGTPFKTQEALVDGYKNIQRLIASKDTELKNLQRQLEIAVDFVKKSVASAPKKEGAEPKPLEGENFWREFGQKPADVLRQIAEMSVSDKMGKVSSELQELRSFAQQVKTESAVQRFISSVKDWSPELEKAMEDKLDEFPELRQWPVEKALAATYKMVKADMGEAVQTQTQRQNAVAGAKKVAGLGGKKTSLPRNPHPQGDEFEDILKIDQEERELYKLA